MCTAEKGAVWSEEGAVANFNNARIYNGRIVVEKDALAQLQVVAIVHMDRRLNPGVVSKQ